MQNGNYLSEEIGSKLREAGQLCSTVQLTIKDEFLHSIQKQKPQSPPTDISREIADTAYRILKDFWKFGKHIRMLSVCATGLVYKDGGCEQISFFESDEINEKRERIQKRERAIDSIRRRFGSDSIVNGAIIDTDLGIYSKSTKDDSK